MKSLRNALIIVLFILFIGLTALWAITYFVQPNTFRLIAKKQLSHLTHQDSAIEGNINWRIFPRPGLHLTKVRIGDVNKIDGDYALLINDLTFHVQLIPLFQGQLVFDKLILDNFTLRIHLNEKIPATTTVQKQPTPANTQNTLASPIPTYIALNKLSLTNGQIIITQSNEQFRFKNVRLEAELPQNMQTAFPIQIKATLDNQSEHTVLNTSLSYTGLLKLPVLAKNNNQLEKIELDGQTTFQNIHFNDYQVTAANARTFFKNGQLELNPLTLSLYNGESVGQLVYQIKANQLNINQTGTGLNAEPVFQHLFGTNPSHLTGTLDFSIRANANFNQPNWSQKINAEGNLTIHNGTLAHLNIPEITAEATKTIKSLASQNIAYIREKLDQIKPWRFDNATGNTVFELFTLQYQTQGNDILNYHLLLETKKLNLKGEGTLNLSTEAIKAKLTAYLMTKDKTTQAIQQLLGNGFPLTVTGTLSNPIISTDTRILESVLSSDALPKAIIKPLNKLKTHIQKLNNAPQTQPESE